MVQFSSRIDTSSADFLANREAMLSKTAVLIETIERVTQGGSEKARGPDTAQEVSCCLASESKNCSTLGLAFWNCLSLPVGNFMMMTYPAGASSPV